MNYGATGTRYVERNVQRAHDFVYVYILAPKPVLEKSLVVRS